MAHMGYVFVPPHNPDDYPPTMGNTQEQAPVTKRFRKNQAPYRICTAVNGTIKEQIVMAVQPVFLS